MKSFNLKVAILSIFVAGTTYAQELHTHSNAASISNEANSVSGWGGSATRSSVSSEAYSGTYSIKLETPSNGWNYAGYGYSTTPNEQYLVKLYAKSVSANNPRIYLTGAVQNQTIDITNTNWTEYSGIVEASGSSMNVNVYTGTPAVTGDIVYIDHVSIVPVSAADTQAPTAPTSLSSTGHTDTTADLSWNAATDNVGVTGYRVYKDGVLEASPGNVTSHQVTGLTASTTYSFTVKALDAAGNESAQSTAVSVTTDSSTDTQAPTAPTSLQSTGNTDTTADLSWTAATDNVGVTGYRVYKDGVLEAPLANVTNYQVTGLTASTTYSFTVTALDAAGNESTPSAAASVTTNAASGGGTSVWSESGTTASYSGEVAVGTTTVPSGYKMAVDGKLITEEVRVELSGTWPDYVFTQGHDLPTLEDIQKHIEEKGHLPNIPSAKEVEQNGIQLGEMNRLLLEKIEQMMLIMIKLEGRIHILENQNK